MGLLAFVGHARAFVVAGLWCRERTATIVRRFHAQSCERSAKLSTAPGRENRSRGGQPPKELS
jgi:hypothetical protein